MPKRNIAIPLLVLVALFVVPPASAQSASDIVKKVRKKYDKLNTLRIDFEQVYHWVLADETNTIRGTLYLTKDNRYRVELPNQLIITDGKTVWTYSKDLNQVMLDRLSKDAGNPVPGELMLRYSRDFEARMVGKEKVNNVDTYVIELVPKRQDEFVRKVRLWIDKSRWIVVRLRQEDLNGNVTVYNVTRLVENPTLNSKLFTFEIPEGAQVVDLRQ
jgi:chaperone LolA